jgi:hypothetical protein
LRYDGLVRAVVGSYRLREADFADAVQNTWLRALERLHSGWEHESFGGWLTTVARRECLALLAESRRESPTGVGQDQLVVDDPAPEATAPYEEALRGVVARMAVAHIAMVLGHAPVVGALAMNGLGLTDGLELMVQDGEVRRAVIPLVGSELLVSRLLRSGRQAETRAYPANTRSAYLAEEGST